MALYFWALPALIVVTDLLIRWKAVFHFPALHWGFYLLSILYSILIYKGLHYVLFRLHKRPGTGLYYTALAGLALVYTLVIVLSYGYYLSVNIMPNYYTFDFIRQEPYNSWTIFRDTFRWYHGILIITLASGIAYILHKTASAKRRLYDWPVWGKAAHGAALLALLFVFNNNVRFADQCFVADVNALGFAARQVNNAIRGRDIGSSGLLARNRIILDPGRRNPGYNVLYVIGESLRRQNMHVYGYNRENTPFLDRLLEDRKDECFLFKRAFTVSTATLLAFPALLTGVSPVQPPVMLHTFPLFFEYARAAQYHTFLISSQTFQWYNFESFFSTPDIDFLWNKEKSGLPAVNDLGVDERKTLQCLKDHLSGVKGPFAGVLHLNTDHYPYYTPEAFRKWGPEKIDLYDNTVLYQDHLLESLFGFLAEKGRDKNTVVVFISDHGEAFREHGFIGHRDYYYIEVLSIPLFVYIPVELQDRFNAAAMRENLDKNVSSLDVIPTLLEVLGMTGGPDIQKLLDQMLGRSLFTPVDSDRVILASNNNEISRYEEGLSLVRGGRHYLLQVNTMPHRQEVYDFIADPLEKRDLWNTLTPAEKSRFHRAFGPYPSCMNVFRRWKVSFLAE